MDQHELDKATQSWEKLLHPQTLRANLILASLYLSAYELLRSSIINRTQSFFTCGFADEEYKTGVDERYNEVKNLHRNILRASCLWLKQNGVISAEDIAEIDAIRQHRNQIAHELPGFLGDIDYEVNLEYLQSIQRLLRKLETWWIRNVDMAINPDFDHVEVTDKDIHPGPVLLLNWIVSITLDTISDK